MTYLPGDIVDVSGASNYIVPAYKKNKIGVVIFRPTEATIAVAHDGKIISLFNSEVKPYLS
jgi:hypothetical protein